MKNLALLILILILPQVSLAEEMSNKTQNIKLMNAIDYIEKKEFDKALQKVDEIEALNNGKKMAPVQNIRIKALIGKREYIQAKAELDKLYDMNPSSKVLKEAAAYTGLIKDGLSGGKPGDTFQDCDICPIMAVIPPGSFQMGSFESEDEQPIHRVNIKQFSMGQTVVTFTQWDACYTAGGCSHNPKDEGWGRGARPVINVSWNDAQEYIKWLNSKTGKHYRLPRESEWEYAARAGSTTKYSWGNNINCSQARYGYIVDECSNQKSTDPVKSFSKNQLGLYDMHGNVWEWVEDKWHDNYSGAPSNGSSWVSGDGSDRVLRGGSWFENESDLRSTYRNYDKPSNRDYFGGFRLARDK